MGATVGRYINQCDISNAFLKKTGRQNIIINYVIRLD